MGFKILVVDDEKDLRDLIRLFLSKEGYDADVAAGGTEALAKVKTWHPNLVITDIRMPQGDGIELMKDISHLSPGRLPILVMSGFAGCEESEFKINPNFAGIMTKPVAWRDLIHAIKSIENSQ